MVICPDYKLLFVEVPNTGSTAIARTLVHNYGGSKILHKHAIYYEFMHAYGNESSDYFVIGGLRNPLETTLTQYSKLVYDHNDRFLPTSQRSWWSRTKRHVAMFNDVRAGMNFTTYLLKYHPRQYHNFYLLGHQRFDAVIRNESLQEGFTTALQKVGINDVANVAVRNPTKNKAPLEDAYTADARRHAVKVFGPFMSHWQYDFPGGWVDLLTDADRRERERFHRRYRTMENLAEFVSRRFNVSPNGSPGLIQRCREATRPITG